VKRIIFILLAVLSTTVFADVEIVVTASRIEEDSKTTPAYVRIIPEEEITNKTTVLDVLKTIPDISVREVSPAKQSISMGGFGDNGFGRTLVLINGRPVNRPDMASFDWNSITLASIERIEIVKGSMSSQYGDQAIAGVINIITKQPDGLTATASASISNTLSNNESAFISYGNKVAGIALGVNRIGNNPTRDRSDSTILSANVDTFYNFAGFETNLGLNYSNSEYQLPGGVSEAQFDDDPDVALNQEDEGTSISYGVNAAFNIKLDSVKISIPLSYSILDYSSDMTSWSSFSDTNIATAAAGVKLSSSLYAGESIEIIPVGGIDFKQNNLFIDKFSSAARTTLVSKSDVSRMESAAWARVKGNYLDTFIIDGGLRYNYSNMATSPEITHTGLVYDIGGVWSITSNLVASLRYGRAFRYPFFEEQYESGYTVLNIDLVPETGNNFTASIDYTKNNLRVIVSPYLISMEDEIIYVDPDGWMGPIPGSNENAESTVHYGVSFESSYTIGIVSAELGYSLDHAEFTKTNKLIPRVPEHNVYGTVSVSPIRAITVSTDGRYSSQFYTDKDNTDSVPGRFEWNMRADWTVMEELVLYLAVNNILDDRTPTSAYGNTSWYPMQGRTFETGLKWVY
jgi:iron complex outermembrane recepter protein